MGQYFIVVNLDKQEYLHAHAFGQGLKLGEFTHGGNGCMAALAVLLADNGAGEESASLGRWLGDRVAIVGDYGATPDHFGIESATEETMYSHARECFKDVSLDVVRDCSETRWLNIRSRPPL